MEETTRAYLAGYFDGEGSVSVQRGEGRVPSPRLQITQRDRLTLERIRDEIGSGCVSQTSTAHTLQIAQRDAVRTFIRLIYPYSRQKRPQLRLAYVMAGLVVKSRTLPPRWAERRHDLASQLAALNLVGKSKPVANRHGSAAFAEVL